MIDVVDLSRGFPLTIFLSGFATATFVFAGLFFFKFWTRTREHFFLLFGAACTILGVERIIWLLVGQISDTTKWLFLFRLSAFCMIILAVIRANQSRTKRL